MNTMASRVCNVLVAGELLCTLAIVLAGCKSKEDRAREEAAKQFAAAAAQMAEASRNLAKQAAADGTTAAAKGVEGAAQGMQGAAQAMQQWAQAVKGMQSAQGKAADPVDFRELRALLPETALGLSRKSAQGEKTGMAGLTISRARGRYEDKDKGLDLKIIDTGGLLGPMAFAAFGLAMVEIDREDDDGYERTSTIDGHKVFEKWNTKSQRGEYKLLAGGRFIIEADGRGIPMADLQAVARSIDTTKLADLATQKP